MEFPKKQLLVVGDRVLITPEEGVPESTRTFHLRTKNGGGQTSVPIILHVKKRPPES